PGIGKTTLVEDFLAALASGGRAHGGARGRCSERLAGAEAYLPVLEALDGLLRGSAGEAAAPAVRLLAPALDAPGGPAPGGRPAPGGHAGAVEAGDVGLPGGAVAAAAAGALPRRRALGRRVHRGPARLPRGPLRRPAAAGAADLPPDRAAAGPAPVRPGPAR